MWFRLHRPATTSVAFFFAAGSLAAAPSHAAHYEFDSVRTEVRFFYTMAFATHRGRFTLVNGTLDYDDAAPEKARFSAAIATASLTTGMDIIDEELKGASFFNVKASPVIAFKSRVVNVGDVGAADVSGDITVNGITRPVTLKVKLKPLNERVRGHEKGARKFIATTRIQRSDFNMTDWSLMVADDIDIEIDAILRLKN